MPTADELFKGTETAFYEYVLDEVARVNYPVKHDEKFRRFLSLCWRFRYCLIPRADKTSAAVLVEAILVGFGDNLMVDLLLFAVSEVRATTSIRTREEVKQEMAESMKQPEETTDTVIRVPKAFLDTDASIHTAMVRLKELVDCAESRFNNGYNEHVVDVVYAVEGHGSEPVLERRELRILAKSLSEAGRIVETTVAARGAICSPIILSIQ